MIFAAGYPLLAEKPLACALDEAREIVRLSEESGVPLAVGLNFRYLPVTRAMREMLRAETLGPPGSASSPISAIAMGAGPVLTNTR